jgi:hypothetical protein
MTINLHLLGPKAYAGLKIIPKSIKKLFFKKRKSSGSFCEEDKGANKIISDFVEACLQETEPENGQEKPKGVFRRISEISIEVIGKLKHISKRNSLSYNNLVEEEIEKDEITDRKFSKTMSSISQGLIADAKPRRSLDEVKDFFTKIPRVLRRISSIPGVLKNKLKRKRSKDSESSESCNMEHRTSVEVKVQKKKMKFTHFKGFENFGNNVFSYYLNKCYMNAILQCLLASEQFVTFFADGHYRKDINLKFSSQGALAKELDNTIIQKLFKKRGSNTISTKKLMEEFVKLVNDFQKYQ